MMNGQLASRHFQVRVLKSLFIFQGRPSLRAAQAAKPEPRGQGAPLRVLRARRAAQQHHGEADQVHTHEVPHHG